MFRCASLLSSKAIHALTLGRFTNEVNYSYLKFNLWVRDGKCLFIYFDAEVILIVMANHKLVWIKKEVGTR